MFKLSFILALLIQGIVKGYAANISVHAIPMLSRPGFATLNSLYPLESDPGFEPYHANVVNTLKAQSLSATELNKCFVVLLAHPNEISARLIADVASRDRDPFMIYKRLSKWRDNHQSEYYLSRFFFQFSIMKRNQGIISKSKNRHARIEEIRKLFNNILFREFPDVVFPKSRVGKLMYISILESANVFNLNVGTGEKYSAKCILSDPEFIPYRFERTLYVRDARKVTQLTINDLAMLESAFPDNPDVLRVSSHLNVIRDLDKSITTLERFLKIGIFPFEEDVIEKQRLVLLIEQRNKLRK